MAENTFYTTTDKGQLIPIIDKMIKCTQLLEWPTQFILFSYVLIIQPEYYFPTF